MLNSLLLNNADKYFTVYIMSADLSEGDYININRKFSGRNAAFIQIKVDENIFRGFPQVKRYPYTIYFRILAPLLLPETVDRILYLDSDTVIHGDIENLYNTDFNNNLFVACTQISGFLHLMNMIRLGVGKDYVYMNTGIMLMNIKELRKITDVPKIRKYTIKNKWKLILYDEDILCKFFGNRVKTVSPCIYNLADRIIVTNNIKNKEKIDADWVKNNNIIIHYFGKNKPWKENYNGILKDYYTKYND